MSFEVFLQRFRDGDSAEGGRAERDAALGPYLVTGAVHGPAHIRVGDGEAEVHLDGDSMMVTHVSGREIWDLLVAVARAAGYTIMPVGCPTCVVRSDAIAHLPEELRASAVVVTSGADLLRTIENA